MRRWVIPGILALVLAVAILLAVTASTPARAPYGFLQGRTPIEAGERPSVGSLSGKATQVLVYTFKSDFNALLQSAIKELKERPVGQLEIRGAKPLLIETLSSSTGARVTLYPDLRADQSLATHFVGIKPSSAVIGHSDRGWVTVVVKGAPEPTFVDRFRSWLGL